MYKGITSVAFVAIPSFARILYIATNSFEIRKNCLLCCEIEHILEVCQCGNCGYAAIAEIISLLGSYNSNTHSNSRVQIHPQFKWHIYYMQTPDMDARHFSSCLCE